MPGQSPVIMVKQTTESQMSDGGSPLPPIVQETTVQRFYFHILAGDLGMIPDTDGAELTDLRAAHQRAVRIMFHTMFSFDDMQDWRGWRVKIADAAGNLVLTVLYHSRYNKRPRWSSM